jgi:hypothetical protein
MISSAWDLPNPQRAGLLRKSLLNQLPARWEKILRSTRSEVEFSSS